MSEGKGRKGNGRFVELNDGIRFQSTIKQIDSSSLFFSPRFELNAESLGFGFLFVDLDVIRGVENEIIPLDADGSRRKRQKDQLLSDIEWISFSLWLFSETNFFPPPSQSFFPPSSSIIHSFISQRREGRRGQTKR